MKKAFFHLLGLSMILIVGLLAAEIIVRVTVERGFRRAWNAFIEGEIPISYAGDDQELIADSVLGFRYNPKLPDTNTLGLMHAEIARGKTPGQERMIVLGDSVTAVCDNKSNSEDRYIRVLQRQWRDKVEVINAAVSGFTIHQERLLLENVLIGYEPDLVVVQYTLNDNARFLNRWHVDPIGGKGLLNTERAVRTLLVGVRDPLWWLPDPSYVATRMRLALAASQIEDPKHLWKRTPGLTLAWHEESWGVVEEELAAMKKLVEQVEGDLVVVMVPFGPQLNGDVLADDRDYVLKPQGLMAKVCARLGVELLDLFEDFRQVDGERFFYDLIHLDQDGHQVVAAALNAYLERRLPEESGETDP